MLSIISFISFLLYSSNVSFSSYISLSCIQFLLSLSFFSAFHINPSLLIFNLAFFMNLVDVDNLDAFGFKPDAKSKAQGWSIFLNKTVGRTVWFQIEKHISGVADIDLKTDLSRFQEVSGQISSLMMLSTLTQRKKTFLRYWMKLSTMFLTSMLRESPV